jgi:hypothetical protein
MHKYPLAIVAGVGLLILISFSDKYQEKRKNNKFLDLVARYGNLFPYLIAMVVGLLVGELDAPDLELGTFIKIPQFKEIISQVSIFGVGIPPVSMFVKALPLALVCYVIAFGDFVTTETLVTEARQSRFQFQPLQPGQRHQEPDPFRHCAVPAAFRSVMGWNDSIRFHPLQGGKESYEVSDRRYGILPYCNVFKCADHSCSKFLPSDLRSRFLHYSDVPGLCLCKDRYGLLQNRP